MKYATIDPRNNQLVKEFEMDPFPDLALSQQAFEVWRKLSVEERGEQLAKIAKLLERDKRKYAELITLEMGKPVAEAEYEISKVISAFDYYIKYAPKFLAPVHEPTPASKSYVRFDPIGIVFSIMPWNFPFWQVFRFGVPTIIAGNVSILKHAPSVPQCAKAIEALFKEAGLPDGVFKSYFLSNEDAGKLIADRRIAGVSFTGSDATGSKIAEQAGRNIKKCVMELGGNDAFVVLADADLDAAVAGALKSRSINTGQSCNAAKRFIVVEEVAHIFIEKLVTGVRALKMGEPMNPETQLGPLARTDLAEKVLQQVTDTLAQGAQAHYGAQVPNATGNYVRPVVLTGVQPGNRAFEEEIFGPVWTVITVKNLDEAISVANNSVYGLGAAVWTKNTDRAEALADEFQSGNFFVNDIVKSDARIPFGGVKRSGFGRELAEFGLKEFVNIKTVWVK